MTTHKVKRVIESYRQFFIKNNIAKIDYPHDDLVDEAVNSLEHCHGMLDKIEMFVDEGRMEKAFRWLGFVQGVLWVNRIYSLKDLRDHSRP